MPEKENIKLARIKEIGAVLTLLVTLATAITAHFNNEKVAKDVYKELSTTIKDISQEQVKMHEDIAQIHGYLIGSERDSEAAAALFANPVPTQTHLVPLRITGTQKEPTKSVEIPPVKSNPKPYSPRPVEDLGK